MALNAQVGSRRTALAKLAHQPLHHPPANAPAASPLEQIDVHVRGIRFVGLGTEVVRLMITKMGRLGARPIGRIPQRPRKLLAQPRPPMAIIQRIKSPRIIGRQGITTHALVIFDHQAQLGLVGQIGADEDACQRVGIVLIKGLAVPAMVASLEAHVVGRGLIIWPCQANREVTHCRRREAAKKAAPQSPVGIPIRRQILSNGARQGR